MSKDRGPLAPAARARRAGRESSEVTRLLGELRAGDRGALDRLFPVLYGELRRLASHYMRDERGDHTLQATALVHEAYARLIGAEIEWHDKAHFFRVAGRAMRRVLVDHARARRASKRGGELARVTLVEAQLDPGEREPDILALDAALEALAERDPRKARAIELHFFVGLSYEEVARVLEISPVTVHRDMTFARAWLKSALAGEQSDGG